MRSVEEIEDKFGISFLCSEKEFLKLGLDKLKQVKNKLNGLDHTARLLESLLQIKNKNLLLLNENSFKMLIIASIWHDQWKNSASTNILVLLMGLFIEGHCSCKIFFREAEGYSIPEQLKKDAAYVISKHNKFNFGRKSIESKIFHDIDSLDEEGRERKMAVSGFGGLKKMIYLVQSVMPRFYYFKEVKELNE